MAIKVLPLSSFRNRLCI